MKRSILVILTIIFALDANSQNFSGKNTIYYQFGGNGLFNSVNYERQIFKKPGLGVHAGLGNYGVKPTYLTVPFGVNYLLKLKNSNAFIDLGFGATYSKADVKLYVNVKQNPNYVNTNYWNLIPSVGYRKLTGKNLMYRFSFTPVINQYDFLPFLGFSIGKSF